MKVLMLGWEFPPFISGGLGTACYGLTRAMSQLGIEITFVLPRAIPSEFTSHVNLASPSSLGRIRGSEIFTSSDFSNVVFRSLPSALQPYQTSREYDELIGKKRTDTAFSQLVQAMGVSSSGASGEHYGQNLNEEVQRYARLATVIAREEDFDIVHAHDWMTYPAGIAVAGISGKPLVVHIHSTEFDRSGENVNQSVYDIERQGFHFASRIIAVSGLTRNIVIKQYGVDGGKISVAYNAIEMNTGLGGPPPIRSDDKIVLFLGRITMQKGPEYFLAAARKVLKVMDNVKFVMAGSGDMMRRTIELAAEMGIGHKVLFTGFLRGDDVDRVFQMADLFVMPSVSEPFGLVPLEALRNDVPVIISKQSGVAEVLNHALKVDFWDIAEMANKIIAVLRHPPLHATLCEHGNFEVRNLSWKDAAGHCIDVYESLLVGAV